MLFLGCILQIWIGILQQTQAAFHRPFVIYDFTHRTLMGLTDAQKDSGISSTGPGITW